MKVITQETSKTVKHPFKTDEKGNPVEFTRKAIVRVPQVESMQDIMDHSQNSELFVVAVYNEFLKIRAQRSANNDLMGMSGGNPELKSLLTEFKRYLETHADMLEEGETIEAEATRLLGKKKFAPLAPVLDAQNSSGSIELDYTGTENAAKTGEPEKILPILRPKLEGTKDAEDKDEKEETEEKPAASRGRKPKNQ